MLVEKEETGSTNDDARALALAGAPHGVAVLARRQTTGRGRAGRAFASPEGGLYLSVVLRPRAPASRWGLLPLAAGLSGARVLRDLGLDARVKWPNDLLLAGRKVGGVLVETHLDGDSFAIVGVGINLSEAPVPEATCLAQHGARPDPRTLAEALHGAILDEARRVDEGSQGVLERLRPLCATLGRDVEWEAGAGVAVDLDADGALLVERPDGRRMRVVAGDVRVRQS